MDRAIMWIMAAGALIGGADRIFGNRLGLGKKFEEGFLLMGSTALSMAGIICLVPVTRPLARRGVQAVLNAATRRYRDQADLLDAKLRPDTVVRPDAVVRDTPDDPTVIRGEIVD